MKRLTPEVLVAAAVITAAVFAVREHAMPAPQARVAEDPFRAPDAEVPLEFQPPERRMDSRLPPWHPPLPHAAPRLPEGHPRCPAGGGSAARPPESDGDWNVPGRVDSAST